MKELLEHILEGQDVGKGLDPLLQKYVWNKRGVDPEKLKKRERAITAYYQGVMRQSRNNSNVAYDKTDKWASGIFV
jgi:hypothetical protein